MKVDAVKEVEEDLVDSLAGDSFSNDEEKDLLRKMLLEAKSHIKESKPNLQRKISMFKNNMKNKLAEGFMSKIKEV